MHSCEEAVFVNSAHSSECCHLPKQHDPPVIWTACQPAVYSSGLSFCQNNGVAPFEARERKVLKTFFFFFGKNIDDFLDYLIICPSFASFD